VLFIVIYTMRRENINHFTDFGRVWILIGGVVTAKLLSQDRNLLLENFEMAVFIQMSKL